MENVLTDFIVSSEGERFRDYCVNVVKGKVGYEGARDAYQDMCINAIKDKGFDGGNLKAYLMTIFLRRVVEITRKELGKSRGKSFYSIDNSVGEYGDEVFAFSLVDKESLGGVVLKESVCDMFDKAGLSRRERQIMEMTYVEGLEYRRGMKRLGISKGCFFTFRARALNRLRVALSKEDYL
jgi:DNA-directed RNA polymerase specialized sigma24 family protein